MEKSSEKLAHLRQIIREMESVLMAYSGGVDSTFLIYLAGEILGERVWGVMADSALIPRSEIKKAREYLEERKIPLVMFPLEIGDQPYFLDHTRERCYFCKKEMFSGFKTIAGGKNFKWVADGSNRDDLEAFRPGKRAIRELGIRSPLAEAGLTKAEIRHFSQELGLPTWDKPSMACLASRIPYGEMITAEKLRQIERAEEIIFSLGIEEVRVRHLGREARIEVPENKFNEILEAKTGLLGKIKALGFTYVTLDLAGLRSGSMDEL